MNPLYQVQTGPNNATEPTKAVNKRYPNAPRNYSEFDLSYFHYKTQTYGRIEPFFMLECVAGDKITLHNSHNVRSLAMKAPWLSSMRLAKDNFFVPMQAILPQSWEYIFKNPSQGDDVPADVNCAISKLDNFIKLVANGLNSRFKSLSTASSDGAFSDAMHVALGDALILEAICSDGSLLSSMNFRTPLIMGHVKSTGADLYIDDYLDRFYNAVLQNGLQCKMTVAGVTTIFQIGTPGVKVNAPVGIEKVYLTRSQFVDFIRSNYANLVMTSSSGLSGAFTLDTTVQALPDYLTAITDAVGAITYDFKLPTIGTLNVAPLVAYQLCCWQFFINPRVDFVYNAEIYRNIMFQNMREFSSTIPVAATYTYNGTSMYYDVFSQHFLDMVFGHGPSSGSAQQSLVGLVLGLFGYNNALLFGDYFSDCRTTPLGIGDTDAPVVGDKVSAVDTTRSILMQRFLNSVVKIGNDFGDYLRGIFSSEPSPDYHYPRYISHQEFNVSGNETVNTAEAQGNVTTQLITGDDTMQYTVEIDMPGYLIGVSYFRMSKVYSLTRDRSFRHLDRFDYFHPFMQFIGDQAVQMDELNPMGIEMPFGYQTRHSEYKQKYSIATGGILSQLPGWLFVSDSMGRDGQVSLTGFPQSPEMIRCVCSDFDVFFSGMTNLSLGHRFHFVLQYDNKVSATRPMIVTPDVL